MTLRMWIYWKVMTVFGPNQSICPVILSRSVGDDRQTREENHTGFYRQPPLPRYLPTQPTVRASSSSTEISTTTRPPFNPPLAH